MSEDLDEQDTYHYDFTTASEWEIFMNFFMMMPLSHRQY